MKNMKIKTYNESIDLGDGRVITIETELYAFEKKEDYDACAGILKAIKEFSK
jgi:hypothetical protein